MIINDYLLTGNNRKMLCGIWRKYQNNEELNGEENNLAGLMALIKTGTNIGSRRRMIPKWNSIPMYILLLIPL